MTSHARTPVTCRAVSVVQEGPRSECRARTPLCAPSPEGMPVSYSQGPGSVAHRYIPGWGGRGNLYHLMLGWLEHGDSFLRIETVGRGGWGPTEWSSESPQPYGSHWFFRRQLPWSAAQEAFRLPCLGWGWSESRGRGVIKGWPFNCQLPSYHCRASGCLSHVRRLMERWVR